MKLTIQLYLVPRLRMSGPAPPLPACLSRVHTDISSVTLIKTSCNAAAEEAQEMKVRLLLFLWQNEPTSAFHYKHFLMYAGMPIRTGGNRNAQGFRQEFEFVGILQIPKRRGIEFV